MSLISWSLIFFKSLFWLFFRRLLRRNSRYFFTLIQFLMIFFRLLNFCMLILRVRWLFLKFGGFLYFVFASIQWLSFIIKRIYHFYLYKIQEDETVKLECWKLVGGKNNFKRGLTLDKFFNIFLRLSRVQISDIQGLY